ncbi:MAG: extracellular solute-binding protein [Bacteroidales bacterium]|nr:extracellular solute-binding protein [Lentimicrobiaceae bacterium]MDD5695980.1 extracellular solute-binding protein [Bacteroidales bacterium]
MKSTANPIPVPTRWFICLPLVLLLLTMGCRPAGTGGESSASSEDTVSLTGELIIFHAGSLAVPFRDMATAFNQIYPGVTFRMEAGGSVASARKIIDLKRPCDIIAVSDYRVIDEMLIPEHASWNIKFAANEMVIAFSAKSAYSETIDSLNWFDILLKDDVRFARSDPDQDPCGYRTLHTFLLAEKYYGKPGLAGRLRSKDNQYIRPKEVDLLALLETHTVDYVFNYRSVACQHHLDFIQLPLEINLKSPSFTDLYGTVTADIGGKEPGQRITITGEPMLYSLTILKDAPNQENAGAFVEFLLSPRGQQILEANGQPLVVPAASASYEKIPDRFKAYATK